MLSNTHLPQQQHQQQRVGEVDQEQQQQQRGGEQHKVVKQMCEFISKQRSVTQDLFESSRMVCLSAAHVC